MASTRLTHLFDWFVESSLNVISHFCRKIIVRLCDSLDVVVAPAPFVDFCNRKRDLLIWSFVLHNPSLALPFRSSKPSQKENKMPQSISSLHSRTATISSSPLSSTFSSITTPSLRGHGSTTGSFSTISSGPFVHADALDSTIQWIPTYYLDNSTQESLVTTSRRNALVIHTPYSSVFSSKVNLLPQGLMRLIRTSDLKQSLKDMLLAMVRMIVHISQQLFPSSHILRDDVARDIENIALDICDFLDLVLEKLEHRLDTATSAKDQLSDYDVADEIALEEVVRWVDIIK
jgi:hypothetical protein